MAMFIKIVKKVSSTFREIQKTALMEELPAEQKANGNDDGGGKIFAPLEADLDVEMEEAGNEAVSALKEKQRELINALDLQK
jgi:N-acetyltransferase 10